MTRDILARKSYEHVSLSNFADLVVNNRLSIQFERFFGFYFDFAQEGNDAVFLIVNRAGRAYLVRLVPSRWIDGEINVFEFVMTVRESDLARRAQPQIEASRLL